MALPVPLSQEARFIGSEIYRGSSYGDWHPLAIPRVSTMIDLGRALGWLPPSRYVTAPRAKPAALTAFHTSDYIAALQAAEQDGHVPDAARARHHLGTHGNPIFPEVYRRPATAAAGSLLAVELLAEGGVIYNPGGGTHHGMPDRANGFCYLNDIALAILAFRRQGLRRIAYVDIDAHHCDGVAAAFDGAEDVLMISTHEAGRWPGTGAEADRAGGAALNLPLISGAGDGDMALLLEAVIVPAVAAFRPEVLILQGGADAVTEDPLSRLACTNAMHRQVIAALRPLAPRLLVTGGGGYNPWSVARCWTAIWAALSGQDMPERLPEAAASVLRGLDWRRQRGAVPSHWVETLADQPGQALPREETREMARRMRPRAEI